MGNTGWREKVLIKVLIEVLNGWVVLIGED